MLRRPVLHALAALCAAVLCQPALAAGADLRLVEAAKKGDLKTVEALLKQRVDVNAPQPDGATALLWAVEDDNLEMAEALLRAGASVHAANDYGAAPLWVACTNGSAPMIERLLRAGADPDTRLPTGESALMAAARSGRLDAVKALLAAGADVRAAESMKGQTALMWAAVERHAAVVRALLERGADVRARLKSGFTALQFAAREGDLDIARLLVERGADVNASDEGGATALLVATVRGHVDLALWLLDHGAQPDGNVAVAGYTPLVWAAGTWESAVTNEYPDAPGEWQALAGIPARAAKLKLIEALLARGANPNAGITKNPPEYGFGSLTGLVGGTAFFVAATVADLDVMRLLIAHGADPQLTSVNQNPLIAAAGTGHRDDATTVPESRYLEAVKFIVGLGADVRRADSRGFNALHMAATAGFNSVVQFLVDSGVPIDATTKNGQTALSIAEGKNGVFYPRRHTAELLMKLQASQGASK